MLSLVFVVFAVLLGADVLFKQRVEEELNPGEEKEFFGGKVIIRKVYNRGFLLNLLDKHPLIVRNATIATGLGILIWDAALFFKKGYPVKKAGMTVLSAGAASNAFDRLARGKVIDYIGFQSENRFLSRITANLGDFYIFCGGLLVMLSNLFGRKRSS